MKKRAITVLLLFFTIYTLWSCTIGVVSGSATPDGRPIIWKSREAGFNVQMLYEDSYTYSYIGSGNSGSEYVWMGMNEAGLAIANAMVSDLDRLPGNGDCMLQALRNYSTIAEFITFLDSTNVSGRETHTNYVMMDATGEAVVLEVSANDYWVYDAADTPYGFIVRNNTSLTGSGAGVNTPKCGLMQTELTEMALNGGIYWEELFPRILRGFYEDFQDQVELPFYGRWDNDKPFGYINGNESNAGISNTSVALMQGVSEGEPAYLSTMWTMLGTPACSIALPYWAQCSEIPAPAIGSPTVPLTNRAQEIQEMVYSAQPSYYADSFMLCNEAGTGYWDVAEAFMEAKFELVNSLRDIWIDNPPSVDILQFYETDICNEGYQVMLDWQLSGEVKADFTSDLYQGEIPLEVHFIDLSLHDPDSLAWDLNGDSLIDSVMTTDFSAGVNWIYEEAGSFDVCLLAYKDSLIDTLLIENYITASYPDTEYLFASNDTLVFDCESPFEQELYIYNIGDYQISLEDIYFTMLAGYPSPGYQLFWYEFADENLSLPIELSVGDSCLINVYPLIPVREYWGNLLVLAADLDTLAIPCLYDENLWQDAEPKVIIAQSLELNNYPNPFNPSTEINYYLPDCSNIEINIYNSKGQKVIGLIDEYKEKGNYAVSWEGIDQKGNICSTGVYYIILKTDNGKLSRRILLLK